MSLSDKERFDRVVHKYFCAWMMHHICDKIITNGKDDLVNQWWWKQHFHHHVRSDEIDIEKLYEMFRSSQFRQLTLHERIEWSLILAGEHYHYQFKHNEFIKMLEEYNIATEDKVDLDWVRDLLKRFNQKKEKQSGIGLYCHLTDKAKEDDDASEKDDLRGSIQSDSEDHDEEGS